MKPQAKPAPSGLPFNAHFVDIAVAAGLTTPVIYGNADSKDYILEATGWGCAFFDYDNNGWMDIFLLSGTKIEGAPPEATNRLYKNNRDGTFTDVTEKTGLRNAGWASGVYVGDYNNDGFEDLFCTYFRQNKLYRNNGDGTFTDVTQAAGLLNEVPRWGAGCTLEFTLHVRIPAWANKASVVVNGRLEPAARAGEHFPIRRNWKPGDVVTLALPMRTEVIASNPHVAEDRGKVAVRCGPIIYCMEELDQPNGLALSDVAISVSERIGKEFQNEYKAELLCGVDVLRHQGRVSESASAEQPITCRQTPRLRRRGQGT